MTRALLLCFLAAPVAAPVAAEEVWAINEFDDTVSVIDAGTLEVVRTIDTGQRSRGVTFAPTAPWPASAPPTATRCR